VLRISGIHPCRRQIAYRRQWFMEGKPELPMSAHTFALFDVGHGIHLRLQERLGNTGALGWVDGEPAVDEQSEFGGPGLFEVPLVSTAHRLRGTLECLSRPLVQKKVWVKSPGELFETFALAEPGDPKAKRYIIDLKSITARDRYFIDEDPTTGAITKAERQPSGFEKLVQPKDEHLGQTMLYSYLVTQPDFQHERLGGQPLETPPDVMIIYQAKDLDPKYYAREPETYSKGGELLQSPFKIFTVPYDQQRVDPLLQKARETWAAVDASQLPGRYCQVRPRRPAGSSGAGVLRPLLPGGRLLQRGPQRGAGPGAIPAPPPGAPPCKTRTRSRRRVSPRSAPRSASPSCSPTWRCTETPAVSAPSAAARSTRWRAASTSSRASRPTRSAQLAASARPSGARSNRT
jgi:hypothetical protein